MGQESFWKSVVAVSFLACLWPAGLAGQENPMPLVLDALVREALENNPAVQRAHRKVEARRRRVPQAKSLPDPVMSVGWMGDIKPFGVQRQDPSSFRSISARQNIPFPGKLKLRGKIVDREAEALWWDYEAVRRQVVANVKAAYYDYFAASKAIEITRRNQDLLEKLVKIAETRYRVGKGVQQDVLRAQVEFSRLRQRVAVLEQQQRTAQVRLNTLLLRDPEAPLGPPGKVEPAELTYALPTLYQLAHENDPGLQREQRVIERSQFAVNLAQKEYYPDLGIGYMYQNRPLMPEMHGFTFSINIPIFYKSKQQEGVNEAVEALASARHNLENRETVLSFEVKQHYLAAKASDELARLYSQAVVPQSSLALESALAAYQVGSVDFLTLIDSFITVLDYEISYYRELANYQIALARLEVLVGVELTK